MDANNLKVWLTFNESPTEDLCGNEWSVASEGVTIGETNAVHGNALQLSGSSSIFTLADDLLLGGQDFTLHFYGIKTGGNNDAPLFCLYADESHFLTLNGGGWYINYQNTNTLPSGFNHIEFDYVHAEQKIYYFVNGTLINSRTTNIFASQINFDLKIGGGLWNQGQGYNQYMAGSIDEFMIHDGVALHTENFTPPTAEDYETLAADLLRQGLPVAIEFDLQREVSSSIKPVTQYVSFTGASGSYGLLPLDVLPGATTFTIEAKFSTTTTASSGNNYDWKTIIGCEIQNYWQDDFGLCVNGGKLCFWAEPKSGGSSSTCNTTSNAVVNDGKIHTAAVVSSGGAIDLYCDGKLVAHTNNVNAKITNTKRIGIANNINNASVSRLQMDLHEARFWSVARSQAEIFADIDGTEEGLEAWYIPTNSSTLVDASGNGRDATLYGSPVYTELTELPLELSLDIKRKVINADKTWRYENEGTADKLTVSGTTLTVDETKSITGTAFYQTARTKCFDIPSTGDVWIKFDLYHYSGTSRFRIYDDKNGSTANGLVLTYNSSTQVALFSWDGSANYERKTFDGVLKANTLQTWLLHMTAGTTDGLLELWCDGNFVGSWTGNVNNGADFANIYFQTDNANNIFSNVIISNAEIGLEEGWHSLSFDVERKVATPIELSVDVEREVNNDSITWIYFNAGTADTLLNGGTTLTNLPSTKSKTGVAFYQSTQAKCFDIPTTRELWIQFDVYVSDGFWKAINLNGTYEPGLEGSYCDIRYTGSLIWDDFTAGELHTIKLHMRSGIRDSYPQPRPTLPTEGIWEFWVDGSYRLGREATDVNNGEPFNNFFLESSTAGAFFSSIIISNKDFDCFWQGVDCDVERKRKNQLEVSYDVQRILALPIVIPPIGEHFNHLISSLTFSFDIVYKFILPKKSKVYVRGFGSNAIRVFSDTDNAGRFTGGGIYENGNMYTQLGECESVFIERRRDTTPQQVMEEFMRYLDSGLDSAIACCSADKFADKDSLVNQFMSDLKDSASYTDFLKDYCDIVLDNDDTGAITGWDAGGSEIKTAASIVPEKIPVADWITPTAGSTSTIDGLTVHWPSTGVSGSLTDTEKHILAGLNSEWIKRSLDLIYESYRIKFESNSIHDIRVEFVNDTSVNALAWVVIRTSSSTGAVTFLYLAINMKYYSGMDMTSEDGASAVVNVPYLDRTLAHELTHAVMAVNLDNYSSLPVYIREGTAELVHGIDDERRNTIVALLTSRTADLEKVFSTGDGDGSDAYAAGYLLLRYLAKQGQNSSNRAHNIADEIDVLNLLISDGAIDSDYEALTDNTRQIFAADILRALSCSFEGEFDIAILSVLTVKVLTDVLRNIIAQINFFAQPTGSSDPDEPNPGTIQLPTNTEGLQSFEVTIAEQQLTDQVRFTSVNSYDIMQKVQGHYLDYIYDMRVERVQKQGILYSCSCCYNIDEMLYTQINYTLPATTTWHKVNGEQTGGTQTVEVQTIYPQAVTHAKNIAEALDITFNTKKVQFEDFLSTVLMEEKGGVTYNDLIRDIFGWSARLPHRMINVYIREGQLRIIQRGQEAKRINLDSEKHSEPIITREILRTSYGTSVESTTTINEYDVTAKTYTPDTVVGGDDTIPSGDEWVTIQDKSSGENWTAVTTYYYSKGNDMSPAGGKIPAGLLVKVETEKSYSYGSEEADSFTQIMHTYDSDGTRIGTETYVHYSGGTNPTTDTRTINFLRYITLPNGEKYLASESTERYEEGETGYPDKLVDSTMTTHSPTRLGQTHVTTITDDGIAGGVTGQSTGDDRITPYSQKKIQSAAAALASVSGNNGTWEETITHHESGITTYGLALYDTSFPVHDEGTLKKITKELKALNRAIQETVTVTVYDLKNLIDFDYQIDINHNTYYLVSNTARTTPRVLLEQNLTLVRWELSEVED